MENTSKRRVTPKNVVLSEEQFTMLLAAFNTHGGHEHHHGNGHHHHPRREDAADKWARAGAMSPRPKKGDYSKSPFRNRLTKDELEKLRKKG